MARDSTRFVCTECGEDYLRWQGRCTSCGVWNSVSAITVDPAVAPAGAAGGRGAQLAGQPPGAPACLASITFDAEARIDTGVGELDRVLGGGLVPGSVILLAGDPGIGKSTLLLTAMAALSRRLPVLYVSGEESLQQIKLRSTRLMLPEERLWVLMETRMEAILDTISSREGSGGAPLTLLAVDSIQTVATTAHTSAAGTVSQVRECAARLITEAKRRQMAILLVGHVTKDGQIAGPKVLEHMVDTVLYFEGEHGQDYRILRAVKNRFGAANEIGVFEMVANGLREVPNPSEMFLAERSQGAPGSVVFAGMEGSRPLLLEIQSLVAPSPLNQPRRTTLGFDVNRLAMLTAVMEKRLGLGLFHHDIFLNIAGGFRITEPAADLAVIAALFSSHRNIALDAGWMVAGEVSLSGEVRPVAHVATRIREADKLGFARCLLPERCRGNVPAGLSIVPAFIQTISDLPALLVP
jgi:DNA repair protein RadA/Sms